MLLCIWLILQVYVSIVYSEGCGEFSFGSSRYEANFVEATHYTDFKTWDEIKDMCQQDYQLVSITTSDENEAILDFLLENCTNGHYAIGLSRQEEMPRTTDSSWNWESGDTAMDLKSFWGSGVPNIEDTMCAVIYMTTLMGIYEPGKWYDTSCTGSIGLVTGSTGYGYICERPMITTPQISMTAGETTIQSSTSGTQSSSTNHMTSLSTTVGLIGETTEVQYGISDAAITNASSATTTAGGTTIQSSTSDTQPSSTNYMTSSSTTVIVETTEVQYGISDAAITKASSGEENNDQLATTQLSTTAGETTIQSSTSDTQSSSTNHMTSLSTTVGLIGETTEVQYGISDAAITKASSGEEHNDELATTQLSTTAGETTVPSSTSDTQSSSTNYMTLLSTTVIGETTEVQYGISDAPITKASSGDGNNDKLDLIMIVLASASPVLVIVILLLLYKFRERLGLCCKSKSKTNPELMMMDVVKNNPMPCETLINSTDECYDIDSANKGSIYNTGSIVLDNGRPSISTANTKGQGKHSGNNNIQVMNTSSDNSRDSDTYHVIRSTSTHDREHPHYYKSEENSNYERYQEEEMGLIYAEITNESEGEVDNPAYEALPFESESLYASPDKTHNVAGSCDVDLLEGTCANVIVAVDDIDMVVNSNIDALYAKPDMSKTRKYQVQSPDNSTLPSETENNYASVDKTTDVVVSLSGDVKEAGAIVVHVDNNGIGLVDDSNIDALYAKPDMNKRRRHEVQSPDDNYTLPSETESNYASVDKTTDVLVSGDVLKGTGAIVTHVDYNGIGLVDDSNIDALYAKPDMNKKRRYQVQSPDSNTLPSETESNYTLPDKTTDAVVSGDLLKGTGVIVAHVVDNDKISDSNIDDLYAKPDKTKIRKYQVQSPDSNTLTSETESNYVSLDKTTDVLVSGDVLKETGAIVAPVDNNDIGLVDDSNIDALYAKPDMNKRRRHEVEGPDNNALSSETESNYASSKTTDVAGSGDV